MSRPLVLLYHAVMSCPRAADSEERGLFVDPAQFQRQMDALAARGFETLTLEQYSAALDGRPGPSRSVLLTFDDAYAHLDEAVTPVLRRHAFSAVLFASWEHLASTNTWDLGHPQLMKLGIVARDRLAEMARGPWEVASHGLRHVDLRGLEPERRRAELVEARERLSDCVHQPVVDLAYPFGFHDASTREDVRLSGYRMAFTAAHTASPDRYQLSRRPIRGTDSPALFRVKTSEWSHSLYRLHSRAPDWARAAARNLLGAGAR